MTREWRRLIRIEAGALLLGRPGFLRRVYDHFFTREEHKMVTIVTWGRAGPLWQQALDPKAAVWRKIGRVGAVFTRSADKPRIPVCARFGRRVMLIPLMERHLLERPRQYFALVGSDIATTTLGDKARFLEYCRERGMAHVCPTSYATLEEATFPCVLKRTDQNNGRGVEIVESLEQGRRLLEGPVFADQKWVLQERIHFLTEYTIYCFCIHGRIRWHVVYAFHLDAHCIRTNKIGEMRRGGEMPAHIGAILESLLVPLDYSGPCNVDCTWDAAGRLKIFEINPRLGGSLMKPENAADLAACLSLMVAASAEPARASERESKTADANPAAATCATLTD